MYVCAWLAVMYVCSYVTYFSRVVHVHMHAGYVITALRKRNYCIEEAGFPTITLRNYGIKESYCAA